MTQTPGQEGLLAQRLERLFHTVHPSGRGEYSNEEVASSLRERGGPTISATYLWQLRKGLRDNPTRRHLQALASFFGVPPAYFLEDEAAEQIDAELELLGTMRDASVRGVALRAAGLSRDSLEMIREVVEHARRLEGLEEPEDVRGRSHETGGADDDAATGGP